MDCGFDGNVAARNEQGPLENDIASFDSSKLAA
jgi:hypothetical protein